jgi:hypothetical protein
MRYKKDWLARLIQRAEQQQIDSLIALLTHPEWRGEEEWHLCAAYLEKPEFVRTGVIVNARLNSQAAHHYASKLAKAT